MTLCFAAGHTHFRFRSPRASALWLCLFDGDAEQRVPMRRKGDDWVASLPGNLAGAHDSYRGNGEWNSPADLWFDPAKFLFDPHAVELDRRLVQDPRLAQDGVDTAGILPPAIVPGRLPRVRRRSARLAGQPVRLHRHHHAHRW